MCLVLLYQPMVVDDTYLVFVGFDELTAIYINPSCPTSTLTFTPPLDLGSAGWGQH